MNYLLEAAQTLGIYYTPRRMLALCFGDGKTRTRDEYAIVMGNPPFTPTAVGSPRYRALARRYAELTRNAQTRAKVTCPQCNGFGVINGGKQCPKCNGSGQIEE